MMTDNQQKAPPMTELKDAKTREEVLAWLKGPLEGTNIWLRHSKTSNVIDALAHMERITLERCAALEEILMDVVSHLAAAISLLENGGEKMAPSKRMFRIMLSDYNKSLQRGRNAIRNLIPTEKEKVT